MCNSSSFGWGGKEKRADGQRQSQNRIFRIKRGFGHGLGITPENVQGGGGGGKLRWANRKRGVGV